VCPEISPILSKLPSEIATKHEGFNTKALASTIQKLEDLFIPLVKWGVSLRLAIAFNTLEIRLPTPFSTL
jgi:hypothetical protein